jgi:threonylcarbamoyladenosine tRNA methylthiotransferase MtaB
LRPTALRLEPDQLRVRDRGHAAGCYPPGVRSVRFVTFGCKANQYDTQLLREALVRRGLDERDGEVDLVVVNTCTVTEEAARKAKSLIQRIERDSPATKICVTGCLAESEPEILRTMRGVHWVLGNGEAKRPASFLAQLGFEHDPEELGIPAGITAFAGHRRAFVKIQDGCDQSCAFCIIPRVRGRSRSRSIPELAREVERLVRAGYFEIVLCGIHIGHWGRDLSLALSDLMHALVDLDPRAEDGAPLPYRLRLSSIEATEVDARLVALLAERPDRIAQHLHMPMQSGDDGVLARMNRWYTSSEYVTACDRIRSALDRPAFTADVIVGFPGESERAFEATLTAARAIGFARIHVFPFSPRPGTAAASMDGAVPVALVRERRARLSELAHELALDFQRNLAGARDTLVLEGYTGLSGRYQRVRVLPEEIDGPLPEAIEIEIEPRAGDDGAIDLVGHPLVVAGGTR